MDSKLIFFIDDDKMILNLLEYTFQNREGYVVKTFFSGEDCLKNLFQDPELIVLDYNFNKMGSSAMTGLETLKKIKEVRRDIPVIMLTSEKDRDLVEQFENEGVLKYVCKDNYFIDTLMETIDNHLVAKSSE